MGTCFRFRVTGCMLSMFSITMMFLFLVSSSLQAQRQIRFYGGYSPVLPGKFDNLIAAYNFSRPWLEKKQPAFRHGYGAGTGMTFRLSERLALHPHVAWTALRSAGSKNGHRHRMSVHSNTLAVDLEWKPFASDSMFAAAASRIALSAGAGGGVLWGRIRSSDPAHDAGSDRYDKPVSRLAFSFHFSAGAGYNIMLSDRLSLMPALGIVYCPVQNIEALSALFLGSAEAFPEKRLPLLFSRFGVIFCIFI